MAVVATTTLAAFDPVFVINGILPGHPGYRGWLSNLPAKLADGLELESTLSRTGGTAPPLLGSSASVA